MRKWNVAGVEIVFESAACAAGETIDPELEYPALAEVTMMSGLSTEIWGSRNC